MLLPELINPKTSINRFKIDITHSKGENGSCLAKGWWQNKFVGEREYDCPAFGSGVNLYVAAIYTRLIDGEVRNFSYIKK